jgi:hypothetical protein
MRYGKELLLGTNVEDDAPYVYDREEEGNYDEARRQGSSLGCCFGFGDRTSKVTSAIHLSIITVFLVLMRKTNYDL